MRLWRLSLLTLRALSCSPGRSLLVIAVATLCTAATFVATAIGRGAQTEAARSVQALVPELVVIRPAEAKKLAMRKEIRGLLRTLTVEDCDAIRTLPVVKAAAPAFEDALRVRSAEGVLPSKVIGTTSAFLEIRQYEMEQGRALDEEDDRLARRNAVVGARVVEKLFGGTAPVGEMLRILGVAYDVVGTLRAKGVSADGADNDNVVLIPIRTALRRLENQRFLTTVFVKARTPGDVGEAERQIRALLRDRHRLREDRADDFAAQDQLKLIAAQVEGASALEALTTRVSAIVLFLGGFGILGLMFLSVRDRTPEIGLRSALGASSSDVAFQFVGEAAVLSTLGGALGVALGQAGARMAALITAWPSDCSPAVGAVALTGTIGLGVAFGAIPALSAARLAPIVALGLKP